MFVENWELSTLNKKSESEHGHQPGICNHANVDILQLLDQDTLKWRMSKTKPSDLV